MRRRPAAHTARNWHTLLLETAVLLLPFYTRTTAPSLHTKRVQ